MIIRFAMPQFLINQSAIKNGVATIAGSDARHITTVLRLKEGDRLMLTDGAGRRWMTEITLATSKKVTARIIAADNPRMAVLPEIAIAQAVVRPEKFESIIQKATELGCSKIIPFASQRTEFKLSNLENKMGRWQKIADEAAKQCGTTVRPTIEPAIEFQDLQKRFGLFEQVILFWEGEKQNTVSTIKKANTLIIIGPKGGFAEDEVAEAKSHGAAACSLGPLILRVETAAIAGLTLVQHRFGYFEHI